MKYVITERIAQSVELGIFSQTPQSATPYEEAITHFSFPTDASGLKGKRIVDIGSGFSNLTLTLNNEGTDAYAIDPVYKDPQQLEHSIHNFFDLLDYYHLTPEGVPFYSLYLKTFREWWNAFKAHPDQYIGTYGSHIPFEDNSIDYCLSMHSLCGYIDADTSVFMSILKECMRITKPGGSIQLYPFGITIPTDSKITQEKRSATKRNCLEFLMKHGYQYSLLQHLDGDTLIISKPS